MIGEFIGLVPRNGARITIRRMSAKTNQLDLSRPARQFLRDKGVYDIKKRVGSLEVWVRYEGMRAVKAGPTRESVIPEYKK